MRGRLVELKAMQGTKNCFVYGTDRESRELYIESARVMGAKPLGFLSEEGEGDLLDIPVLKISDLSPGFFSKIKLLVPFSSTAALRRPSNKNVQECLYVCKNKPRISDIEDIKEAVSVLNLHDNPLSQHRAATDAAVKKSCPVLNAGAWIDFDGAKICCFMPPLAGMRDVAMIAEKIMRMRNEIYKRMDDGESTFCSNCAHLSATTPRHYSRYFKKIGIGFTWKCNFHCRYCTTNKTMPNMPPNIAVKLINQLIESKAVRSNTDFAWAGGGEPVLAPYFAAINDRLLDLGCVGRIFSNASLYSESIESGLKRKRFTLVTSVDAGSREVFYKIKRNDCYEKVIANISRYVAAAGPDNIYVKYIVIEENADETEFERFLTTSARMGVKNLILARDFNAEAGKDKPLLDIFRDMAQARGFALESPSWV